MTLRAKIEAAAGILVLALLAVGFYAWLGEHDARLKADADAKSRQAAFDQAGKQIKDIQEQAAARDREAAARVTDLLKIAAAAKTPSQIAGYSQAQLEQAIAGIKITLPPATAADPHPAAVVTIPEASLPQLRDTIAKCETQAVQLTACQGDIESRKKEQAFAQTQIEQLQGQVQDYKKAAGQTKWQRAWQVTKIALGVGAGYVIGRASKK